MLLSRRRVLSLMLLAPLAACAGYQTYFPEALSPEITRNWRVSAVQVSVPESLSVSEDHSYLPQADIVWREDDPNGDRHAQVAVIMRDAIQRGAAGLRGATPVVLQVTVSRFHALTFEAETRLSGVGVHNIQFDIQVVSARTGEVLVPPTHIQADLPALSGREMAEARQRGETQKSQIEAHVARTIAAWLGIGPDNRGSFGRLGD